MTTHGLTEKEWRQRPAPRDTRSVLFQLGWPHFWLLTAILGGMLGLVGLAFLAHAKSLIPNP